MKIAEFYSAMLRYNSNTLYTWLERINSVLILSLQSLTLLHLLKFYDRTSIMLLLIVFFLAYGVTDFINGLIHMFMDNNTHYTSIVGPFISSFHLHHATLFYNHPHALSVYFYESGTKFWLLAYLIGLVVVQYTIAVPYSLNFFLVSIGILSSIAEVSHYWCHNATKKNKVIFFLQSHGILLSKKHHFAHHRQDNTHYAFLNGMTDVILNKISRHYCSGYKSYADQHVAAYLKLIQHHGSHDDNPKKDIGVIVKNSSPSPDALRRPRPQVDEVK